MAVVLDKVVDVGVVKSICLGSGLAKTDVDIMMAMRVVRSWSFMIDV